MGHGASIISGELYVDDNCEVKAVGRSNKLRLREVVDAFACDASRNGRWLIVGEDAKAVAAEIVERHAERLRQDAIRASRDAVLAQERAMADVLREAVGDAAEVETGRAIVDLRGLDAATLRRVGAAIRGAVKP